MQPAELETQVLQLTHDYRKVMAALYTKVVLLHAFAIQASGLSYAFKEAGITIPAQLAEICALRDSEDPSGFRTKTREVPGDA